ncbi:MAG TPA: metallophosphoesterase [Oribacterium sp.]|nr:metallophosphoesterase [Oribacterium sp.]HCS67681.1 metallophosphoesterase [Oribacterium sp.]
MLRMLVIIGLLLVMLIGLSISEYERSTLKTESYTLYAKEVSRPYRFLFLSDLHEVEFGKENARLLQKIEELDPEFILIGGDFIRCHKLRPWSGHRHRDSVEVTCRFLEAIRHRYPVYYAIGNHEERLREKAGIVHCTSGAKYDTYIQNMARADYARLEKAWEGVQLIDNTRVVREELELSGLTLDLSYFRNLLTHQRKPLTEEDIRAKLGAIQEGRYPILLLHTPLYGHEALREGEKLVLSGHYHGGTIRIPGLGALMTPQFQFFVRECAGRFEDGDGNLIINRGLGTHSINLRINDKPEISLITLRPEQERHGTGINI